MVTTIVAKHYLPPIASWFLSFEVTLKVFTPYLGVVHEIWGAWCMIIP
jgi:hypothetical protein